MKTILTQLPSGKLLQASTPEDLAYLSELHADAMRYRWLRHQFSLGNESYIGENMDSEVETDNYIDSQMIAERGK